MTGASIRFPHLGIVIEHLDKSISIFGFNIAYYGIIHWHRLAMRYSYGGA